MSHLVSLPAKFHFNLDSLIFREKTIFGYGWLFHEDIDVANSSLEITFSKNAGECSLPFDQGKQRPDLPSELIRYALSNSSGFVLYGGVIGAFEDIASFKLVGQLSNGKTLGIHLPLSVIKNPGVKSAQVQRAVAWNQIAMLAQRRWRLIRREQFRFRRLEHWRYYHALLEPLELQGKLRRMFVPDHCDHNAHMYYVLLPQETDRQLILDEYKKRNISTVFHYVPLHSSPAGQRYGRTPQGLPVTDTVSEQLIRLPLWVGISKEQQESVIEVLSEYA